MSEYLPKKYLIGCIDITKTYQNTEGDKTVFSSFNLNIEVDKVTCILGPSGCGKSTLINIISKLDKEIKGEVVYQKVNLRSSYLFQDNLLLPWLNAYQNAFLGIKFSNKYSNELKINIDHLFTAFGMKKYKKYYPKQLSGGMKQRVALIRALASKPNLIFFDEPFTALDFKQRLSIEKLIIQEKKLLKQTLIFITHNIEEAIALGDRVIVINGEPAKLIYDTNIHFDSDRAGRDPIKVRQDSKFSQYFKNIYSVFENEK